MPEKLLTFEEAVLTKLCQIVDLLIGLAQQGTNKCCELGTAQNTIKSVAASTSATKQLGNNPRRLSFSIANPDSTSDVLISTSPAMTSTSAIMAIVPAGGSYQFSGINFPASVKMEWYVRSKTGAPNLTITEEEEVEVKP